MFYSIEQLCPVSDDGMSAFGLGIKLYPLFKTAVQRRPELDQSAVDHVIRTHGREWLDRCGFDAIFDPDNCGFDRDLEKPPGPNAEPMYQPGHHLRVTWGEWGPEHITVPGDACG